MAQRSTRQRKASEKIVDQFWTFFESSKDPVAAWRSVHQWWLQETDNNEQSWKSASGAAFELIAQRYVQELVNTQPHLRGLVKIFRWKDLPTWLQEGILAERVWQRGELREPVVVPSQADMAALQMEGEEIRRVISIYSCKSSAAERYQQDLFWAERLRGRGIRFCFITLDEGFLKYALLGGEASKGVRLAMALYDRVYLFTNEPLQYGSEVFQPISSVVGDLMKWMAM
jgi:hypothetical protein